ncbi:hypothetical protein ACFFIO_07980 [Citricoccus parietis]|uniref:Integral membrane protein n=1 Tax=Citricoccus parietis TaxID=592307 RepID=A0ABV6F4K7_9MICC|nr:hypothetical protein [Cellulosimicrobium funkei]
MNALTSLSVMASGYDPGVKPNLDAPWMPELQNIGGMVLGTALVLFVIAIGVGLAVWLFGKIGPGGGRAQEGGLSILLWGVVASIIIGSLGGLIAWATGIPVFA